MLGTLKGIRNIRAMLKGQDKYETAENYSIAGIIFGTVLVSIGIISTLISTQGVPAVVAMLGAMLSFLSVVALIIVWTVKELLGKE